MPERKPFVLIGMEHTLPNVDNILVAARKNFSPGSRVMVELPEGAITFAIVMSDFAMGGVLSDETIKRVKKYPPAIPTDSGFDIWLKAKIRANIALSSDERRDIIRAYDSSFACKFINGLRHSGILPVGGDSRFTHDALSAKLKDSWQVQVPVREKYFIKRLVKGVEKGGVVGGMFGSLHLPPLKRALKREGIQVKQVLVETKLVKIFKKSRYLIFQGGVLSRAYYNTRETYRKVKKRFKNASRK